jgi:hypothetical protein
LKATRVLHLSSRIAWFHAYPCICRSKVTFWLQCLTSFEPPLGNSNRTSHVPYLFSAVLSMVSWIFLAGRS